MNNNVKMIDWKENSASGFKYRYYINETAGTTKCDIMLTNYSPFYEDTFLERYVRLKSQDKIIMDASLPRNFFSATVKLRKNDIWDEEKGKKIAYRKAVAKLYKLRTRLLLECKNELLDKVQIISQILQTQQNRTQNNLQILEELMK